MCTSLIYRNTRNNDPKYAYHSYQSSVICYPKTAIQYPSSISNVVRLVKNARKDGVPIKAIGSRHSITDIICTDGTPISLKLLTKKYYHEDNTATFEAGIKLDQVLLFLQERNRTLINIPIYSKKFIQFFQQNILLTIFFLQIMQGGITLAGAIATGAHGSSLKHPASISDQIIGLQVVTGTGELVNINDTKTLKAFRVNLGLLGIVVKVTLKIVPIFKMSIQNSVEEIDILTSGKALEWAREYDHFQLWWFPSLQEVVVAKGNYLPFLKNTTFEGNATNNLITEVTQYTARFAAVLYEFCNWAQIGLTILEGYMRDFLLKSIPTARPLYEEGGTFKNPAVGIGWRLLSSQCRPGTCWWDNPWATVGGTESAIAFDTKHFKGVMTMIQDTLREMPTCFYMSGILIRFMPKSEAYLSLSSGRETFSVEWVNPLRTRRHLDAVVGLGTFQAILQRMVRDFDGIPHWGKNGLHFLGENVLKKNRDNFIAEMKNFDPDGVFLNKFGRRLTGEIGEADVDPEMERCALHDYCICGKDYDCGVGQRCEKLSDGVLVCRDQDNVILGGLGFVFGTNFLAFILYRLFYR